MIKIFSIHFNNPQFLDYQFRCFKVFFKNNFEFVCINNAKDCNLETELNSMCNNLQIQVFKPNNVDHSLGGLSHYGALQWCFDNLITTHSDISIIIDHDIFPFKNFCMENLLEDNALAGVKQIRGNVYYLHPMFLVFNSPYLKNLNEISLYGGIVDKQHVDVGGELYCYLKRYPETKIKFLSESKFNDTFNVIENTLIHIRNGSNWMNLDANIIRKRDKDVCFLLNEFLKK